MRLREAPITTIEQLGTRYHDLVMEAAPTWAALLGDRRFTDRAEDYAEEAEDRLIDALDGVIAETESLDLTKMTRDEAISRGVLLFEARGLVGSLRARSAELLVDPMLGPHTEMISSIPSLSAPDDEQAAAYVRKASATGEGFDQAAKRLRIGVSKGRTPPRISVEKSLRQMDAYLASPVSEDPWLQIAPPPDFTESQTAAWRSELADCVASDVRPAVERYRDTVRNEVLPAARPPEKSGLCWIPGGEQAYANAIYRFTSLDADADAIHQIGLDEIRSLADEYPTLSASALGTTDLDVIFDRLRSDPALRFDTAEEVRAAAQTAMDRAKAAIPDWFGRRPLADCVMDAIPEVSAADNTLAYYLPPSPDGTRPGTFFINLAEPTTRTRYESEALAFHESIPGHHLQLAIAQEVEELPEFRKHALVTVYVEGWGLYTERLADEMGLYSGDLQRLGILSFDSWRAGRLVTDTGIHAKGWSRDKAIAHFVENSPQALNNIENEVDRYIGWPGQALGYKIGQRAIFDLRDRVRTLLGSRFSIKGFHDAVLEVGPVPIDVLDDVVMNWASNHSAP